MYYRIIIQAIVTGDNVVTVSQNLTTLVNEANDTADRNTDNLQVVTNVLTQTAALLTSVLSTTLSPQEVEMVSNEHTIVYSYSIVNRLQGILLIHLTMFNGGLLMLFKLILMCKLLL